MFNPTRPFKDTVTNYPKEPSLRIGRTVPKDAVNLAYYFNPTATDAEKILTAEAPRNTIDHRVEEAYRYLFNQAVDDDDLFPAFVPYEDEEGYQGKLGRMFVNWYPEAHVKTKNHQVTKDFIVEDRSQLLKMIGYPEDAYGYSGNLYLDAANFEIYDYKDETVSEILDREVFGHEISYNVVHGSYIAPADLETWMTEPIGSTSSYWPSTIEVGEYLKANGGTSKIQKYVNAMVNPYDDAKGTLVFDRIEYEPVYSTPSQDGTSTSKTINNKFVSESYVCSEFGYETSDAAVQFIKDKELEVRTNIFKENYHAVYDAMTDKYDYSQIEEFITTATTYCDKYEVFVADLQEAINANMDIVIVLDSLNAVMEDTSSQYSNFHFEAKYYYKTSTRGIIGGSQYNVIAVYKGTLKKTITKQKQVPNRYTAHATYVGILRKVWYDYDGMAYYRGAVTKGNSVGNMNPEDDNELLMFSDGDGYLRIPTYKTEEDGDIVLDNYYEVEADSVYLTDVFRNNVACFYKYPLKRCIYDYRGPDQNGFYEGNAVKVYTADLKELPSGYEYNMKLRVADTEIVDEIIDGYVTSKEVPTKYDAELYTSFISCSTDTFKVTYNAFDDNDQDNVVLDNGVSEDIYNYPFMLQGVDYFVESVDKLQRTNKIKLPKPYRLRDSRRYVTFTFVVNAARKGTYDTAEDGTIVLKKESVVVKSEPIVVSILNRDYALPIEYDKFDGRGYIVSPISDGIYFSPMDIILKDQATRRDEIKITSKDTDFVFYCTITEINAADRGAVNMKCNPDGSGLITAETTVDTGFVDGEDLWSIGENQEFDTSKGLYSFTKKLTLDAPYFIENGWIYPGIKVKCIDSRYIKVVAPREDGLLDSWYPMIRFGHYSQVLDQYGGHTKICYTMPEYDEQHYSPVHGKPFVDITREKVTILNSHMVKTKCFPLFIKMAIPNTIRLYKELDGEEFDIDIQDVSFSDGIIITTDTISENDNILCDYTYLEENYIYRGYWRTKNDFVRIDLNPNMYHTYSDMNYIPSETKPTKNLFNKVIYFFMRPSLELEGIETVVTDTTIDSSDEDLLAKLFNESDLLQFVSTSNTVQILSGEDKLNRWANVNGTIQGITNENCLYIFKTADMYEAYEHTVTLKSTDADNDVLVVVISVFNKDGNYETLSLVCRLNKTETHVSLDDSVQFALVYNYCQPNQVILKNDITFNTVGGWSSFPNGITVKIFKDASGNIKIFRTEMGQGTGGDFNTLSKEPVLATTLTEIKTKCGIDFKSGAIGYGNVSQSAATFCGIRVGVFSENSITRIEYDYENPVLKTTETLYHQIDNDQPQDNRDIYIGSVFIRQNCSLHSTILVDSRTRGGGVLESMKDSLRHELEPESDFYLDIGYYDGEPYQENGVIIVRLDKSLLKEFGGRFTHGDIEVKVKRWLGFGVYPIIEYVDAYVKQELPQYTLEVKDSYTNVVDETPEIQLECINVS